MKALMLCLVRNSFNSTGFTFGSVILKNIILVSTFSSIWIQPSDYNFLLSFLAASLSSNTYSLMVCRATIPISATMPGFLRTPPSIFLFLLKLAINYLDPTTIDPMGVQSPLLKQNITESHSFTSSFGSIFNSAQALNILAPSIWICSFYPFAMLISYSNCPIGYILPQDVGFYIENTVLLGACESFTFLIQFFSPATGINILLSH